MLLAREEKESVIETIYRDWDVGVWQQVASSPSSSSSLSSSSLSLGGVDAAGDAGPSMLALSPFVNSRMIFSPSLICILAR